MTKLEKHIHQLNKTCDEKRQAAETIAERVCRLHNEQKYSPIAMQLKADKKTRTLQKSLARGYNNYLKLHDESKVGTYLRNRGSEYTAWVVQTELGPIVRLVSSDKKSVYYTGYSVSQDLGEKTQHYYYTKIACTNDDSGKLQITGFIRDDNGWFHEWDSERGMQLNLRPMLTLKERFDEAIRLYQIDRRSIPEVNPDFDLEEYQN